MPFGTIPMDVLANLKMTSYQVKIPYDWKQPMGDPDQDHFVKAFSMSEHVSGAAVKSPPEVVGPATTNAYHGDAAKAVSGWYKDFMKEATDKIKLAVTSWSPKTKVKSVQIAAVAGMAPPGAFDAQNIKNEPAFSSWQGKEKNAKAYIKAVVTGFSKNWMEWSDKVSLPGLPLWPAFAAFPLASIPPMPGLPMPLIAWISAAMTKIAMGKQLGDSMTEALDGGIKDEDGNKDHEKIFASIGEAVATNVLAWMPSTMVNLVMGKGPVPSYAPPYVPVGPCVMGDVLGTGGHLV